MSWNSFFDVSDWGLISDCNQTGIIIRMIWFWMTSTCNTYLFCCKVSEHVITDRILSKHVIKSFVSRVFNIIPINKIITFKDLELKSKIIPSIVSGEYLRIAH